MMRNKHMIRTLAVLLAVMLCMTAFSTVAFASDGEAATTSEAQTEPTDSADITGDDLSKLISALFGSVLGSTEKSGKTGTVTTNGGKLNVRTGAGLDNYAFTQLPNGTVVEVVGTDGDWYMIRLPEKIGYVYSGYMTLSDTGGENDGNFSFSIDPDKLSELFEQLMGGSGGAALTPDGNLSLIDDIGSSTRSGKQFIIIMLAPIFSGEYEGVDNIILTSKYGKTKCATAKVVAGIITAILTTTLIAAFNLLLAFVFYGTEGLDCSILFAPSDYVEAFIPFNITCGTLLKYQILLAFTCTLSVTGITLFLSAISKNQIVALVAAMAIFLFPVLLPITEVNPLFRLVGLLPIYHVLAISLLSVEQMSNGMLYAIWAIPAALLFLGVGAGISRRVFAKHQVL